jgi:predicted membrane protein
METSNSFLYKPKRMKKIVFGLFVVLAGSLLLAFNLGYIPMEYKHLIFNWQVLLITIGLTNLFCKDSWLTGVVLIAVGVFFWIPMLYMFPYNFRGLFWPALLIFFGIMIIIKRGFCHKWHSHHRRKEFKLDSGFIEETNIFSGTKQRVSPVIFTGGKITNIFGGSEIDLTQTTLAEGKNVLEIFCAFGGVSLLVPSDWVVHIDVASVLGGFVDKRKYTNNTSSDNSRELYIKGNAIFGGGDLKSI